MRPAVVALLAVFALPAAAGELTLAPRSVPEWKAVYGRVEARDTAPARARIGGTLTALEVTEGDTVKAGQRIATVVDEKLAFRVAAAEAQLKALGAELKNAEAELARGQALVEKGVATTQRLGQLSTEADVIRSQMAAAEAERQVAVQQGAEGEVLAPADGRVLTVPVTHGAVVMAGETVATIGSGGVYLRLAIPERHATTLEEGARLAVETGPSTVEGRLAKIYPEIENGRVVADVEVEGLPTAFMDARLLVRVPVGERDALLVPAAAVVTRSGLDFVRVRGPEGTVERVVVPGERVGEDVEILTGLSPGDVVVTP